ncbi:Pumilio 2 [Vanrija pseudolonga]|uniref:Pumilio 2 n=1 Tax=Vanrija pseudolonga TaxID=143232 RepID=A0AAF0YBG3_9TREE|nr:Pumilio 2 [Vanrija pseudolonga]
MENSSDLSSRLSALSVDEAHSAGIRQPGGIPPTPPYANVHTPQRPAFTGYDGGGQFLYYASASVDPATYGAAASAHQAYSYTDLTATPIQSLGSPGGVAYDPYPTPPDNYTTHSPDTRASANQGQPGMTAFQQQIVAAAASARNQTIYRPPQLQPQIHQQVVAQNQVQHGYFAYDRAPYWTHQSPARENNRHRNNLGSPLSSGSPRRNSQHQQTQYALGDFAAHTTFAMQNPLSSGYATAANVQYTLGGTYPYSPSSHYPFTPRQSRRHSEDTGAARSQRLEEFRQRKGNRAELAEIYGSICEFAGDQHGSRFIQNKLESATADERAKVFEEIMPNAYQLMTDVFGNYVIQKLFEHGDQNQKAALAKKMEGHVLQLSMQMYGCRVMQKALEHVLVDQREKLIAELNGHIIECVKSANANHVIQRLISLDPPSSLTDAFVGHVHELSTHSFGCRVLQKAFEVLPPEKIRPLLNEMHSCSPKLMVDQFGNYVVQSVITNTPGREYDRDKVVNEIKTRVFELSRHKFASNVVEKALKFSRAEDRRVLIAEMIGDKAEGAENRIATLLRDSYGNFPVQTALAEADPDQRDKLLAIIVPLMPNLRHTPCGRRLEAKITDYEQKGIIPSLSNSITTSSANSPDLSTVNSDSEGSGKRDTAVPSYSTKSFKPSTGRRVVSSTDSLDEAQVVTLLA